MALPTDDNADTASSTSTYVHKLPEPFTTSDLVVLTQGAEGLVYRTTFLTPNTPCVLKYRPPKPYRHPTLDKRLTKARLLAEARVLVKCRREGLQVPAVLGGDWEDGWLALEWVDGRTVREVLDIWVHKLGMRARDGKPDETTGGASEGDVEAQKKEQEERLWEMMRKVGRAVGRLHEIGVCHGDLTTSNLMIRHERSTQPSSQPSTENVRPRGRQTVSTMREAAMNGEGPPQYPSADATSRSNEPEDLLEGAIVMIDFGLATQTVQDEDRAVDLYVLERAFTATHPAAEHLFQEAMRVYGETFKGAKKVLKRLADVRLRGRKRTMIG
ncbi:kinase-like protein [Polyplosphaeria fusca]|uniref:EKC/KEOPS complex subunit BUD32 n=1 Tax=Polyplosphaeria fusca TaxID=682080 RepID=A0A9P4RBW8_9PLEO|nr:kinase-like protein [Polyplosphaeria fusca]